MKEYRVDINKLENSERDGNTRSPYLPPVKHVCTSKSKLELEMEQQTGSKLEKKYIKAVYWTLLMVAQLVKNMPAMQETPV